MIRQSGPVLRSLRGVLYRQGASSEACQLSCVLSSRLSSAPGPQHTPSSAAGLATAAQQLVKLQQQQEQQTGAKGSGGASWRKLLGAGAAAAGAAAVGWAAWSDSTAKHAHARAEESRLAFVPRTSPKAQAALVSCYLGPLVTLLHGLSPTQPQLQSMAAAVAAEASVLTPWELLNALWGLAMFGVELNPQQLQVLVTAASNQLQQLTVYQAIVAAWAATMLCGSSSSWSAHDVVAAAKLCSSTWQQLLQRLQSAAVQEYDESAVLYLLHAAVQQAAVAADGNAAGRSGLPRATGHEVLHQLKQLPERVKHKVAAAYQEYVPFQQYIEGPYLTILHIAKALPAHISAAGAASPVAAGAASPYSTVFGAFSAADADAARTVFSDSGTLSKLRRNLYFSWRSDELLDRHQQNLNQVAHVLSRRLAQQQVQQPPDIDVLLPMLKAAVFLDDDVAHHYHQQQHLQQDAFDAAMPFTARYWAACHDALMVLMRNRYSAPPGGFACKSTAGIRAAKSRCLEQRGWRVVHIGLSEVEACSRGSAAAAGGQRNHRNRPADYAALEALLRQRLEL